MEFVIIMMSVELTAGEFVIDPEATPPDTKPVPEESTMTAAAEVLAGTLVMDPDSTSAEAEPKPLD